MADAPRPITSPPSLPWQPYDATAPGELPSDVSPETVYDSVSSYSDSNPWRKVNDAGAADSAGRSNGAWPGNGDSDAGAWKQC